MVELSTNQSPKEVAHKALKHYPRDKPASFDVFDSNQPNIQRDTIYEKEPQRNHSDFLEILSGVLFSPLVLVCDSEYMRQKGIEINSQLKFVELCCLLEDEVFMSNLEDNEIHLIANEEDSERDRITWIVEYQSRRYIAETDLAIIKLYIFQENNTH